MQQGLVCNREDGVWPAAAAAVRTALLTPPGRGALAVVGVAGDGAVGMVARVFEPNGRVPLVGRADGSICVGRWGPAGEELVVVRRNPASLEVHCHGGVAAAEAVMAGLESLGGVRQPWAEWLAAGGTAEIEVEAREAVARAGGPKAAMILSRQLAGALEREIDRVRELLKSETGDAGDAGRHAAIEGIDRLRRAARVGLRLTRPWRVVLTGAVNAGKSSLVNALAGSPRSLVSAEPGTTRDVLETRLVIDGWEVELIDTAGLRGPADAVAVDDVEREGITRAVAAAAAADLVLRVVDCRQPRPRLAGGTAGARELLVLTKSDLDRPGRADDGAPVGGHVSGTMEDDADVAWTSAVTGSGIDGLLSSIIRRLVPEERHDPTLLAGAVPFTPRQVALIEELSRTGLGGDAPPAGRG